MTADDAAADFQEFARRFVAAYWQEAVLKDERQGIIFNYSRK